MRLALVIIFLLLAIGCGSVPDHGSFDSIEDFDLSESTQEVLAIGQQNGTSAFTYVGLGLFVIGSVMFATVMKDGGLKLIACGLLAGSIPYVIQSSYFSIIVSGALLISLLIAVYHLWWKVRKIENGEEEKS